ncbi:hypothetical protein O7621_07330 [Solwaraspora sp. WMMD937]|uniref:hypothetical protein n=1 Tax=Solwaraspora sp. WMMD937 TaxID=3016090 RepID=UPI00249A9A29|nr:hypothetical protein [Solwaraspora sp. WMMD937]WFE24791.1 hypothetical protein O7621_07330 [Solwaraspora sp. WMMD937]
MLRSISRKGAAAFSKARNANERLRRLREEPVPRPADPLRFTACVPAGPVDADTLCAQLTDVRVGDRLHAGVTAGREEYLSRRRRRSAPGSAP